MSMIRALLFCSFFAFSLSADEVVFDGSVNSDGTPSKTVSLDLLKKYQLKVSGFVNLGKWVQNREKLANDAEYEFNNEGETEKIGSLKNSLDIPIGDGKYHADHVYLSEPFTPKQNKIHFWVYDTDYEDNHGEFKVEVLRIGDEKSILAE